MLFLLGLIGWAIAELAVVIVVAHEIGLLLTILLLLVTSVLGWWAMRLQGAAAVRRFSTAIAERRTPGKEVLDGALILTGGFLLILPGFIGDALGICALFPPTRALLRRALVNHLGSRVVTATTRFGRQRYDVESTARDLDQPGLHP